MFDIKNISIRKRCDLKKSIRIYIGIEGIDFVECKICKKRSLNIDKRHLKNWHDLTLKEYMSMFPDACISSEKKKLIQTKSATGNTANLGKKFTKDHKNKIARSQIGSKNSFYGRKHSVESKDLILKNMNITILKKYGVSNPVFIDGVKDKIYKKRAFTIGYIRDIIESIDGYKLLSKNYKNIYGKLKIECPNGHKFKMRYNNFQSGQRCPMCSKHHSKAELEIYKLVRSYFPDTISGDRKILNGLELDVYVPSKNIAIEYCGLYWHSEQQGKNSKYHLNKLDLCKEQGIDLITIFEDEYINRSEVVISRIKNKLGVSDSERVYARKCVIKEIEPKVKNEFLNKFHLQGADSSSVKLGAFYKDKLVSVMTFSRPSISKGSYNKIDTYELNRFCSDSSYLVIGIASKLFKYFTRNYEFKYCFSFGDKRWSSGNVYKNLGFEKEYDTKPNYWYIIDGERKHRYNYRKSELNKKLKIFNPELSEYKNMLENGLDRIWDQGSVKWRYIK